MVLTLNIIHLANENDQFNFMVMVQWTDPDSPCSYAKQLWLGYTANAVYIQHTGLELKLLHYNVVSEVTDLAGPGMQIYDGPFSTMTAWQS